MGKSNNTYGGDTILCFHIGRGGRSNNGGFLTFKSMCKISDTQAYNELFLNEGDEEFTDCSGNGVGLTIRDVATGVGRIDNDGEYNTTYTRLLSDLNETEIEAVKTANTWDLPYIIEALAELGLIQQ